MQKKNLYAQLCFFDGRAPSEVRGIVADALGCTFDEEFAKSDELGTTWFADAFGFEIVFGLISRRADGAWYLLTTTPGVGLSVPDAPKEDINFHVSQVLRTAGFDLVVTMDEYNERHHQPAP